VTEALQAAGFWSYVRADDDAERGRISQLAEEVIAQYRLSTASELDLFLDRASLSWGDDWREQIDAALRGVTFFIPIVTPSYFTSSECRRELLEFARRADSANLGKLILPIYYMTLLVDLDRDSDDPAVAAVARRQYEDWRDLRLTDAASSAHRTGVQKLVLRLIEITQEVSALPEPDTEPITRADVKAALQAPQSGDNATALGPDHEPDIFSDEEPAVLELLAIAEESMPLITEKVNRLAALFELMSQSTQAAQERMQTADSTGKGFAGRVHQTHALANDLAQPAEEILTVGQEYSAALANADPGIRALFDLADSAEEPADRDSACELFQTMRDMADSSRGARDQYQELITTLTGTARFSRALRPPLANIVNGVRHFADGHAVIEGWVARIDDSPLDCTGWTPSPDNGGGA
jgi:hypothetical protein